MQIKLAVEMEKILQGGSGQNVLDGEKLHFKVSDLYPGFCNEK